MSHKITTRLFFKQRTYDAKYVGEYFESLTTFEDNFFELKCKILEFKSLSSSCPDALSRIQEIKRVNREFMDSLMKIETYYIIENDIERHDNG